MFLGHYGLAFAAKRASPETSLGTLTFAAQWLDELWPILLLLGVEQVRIAPHIMAKSDLDFVSYPISHSLLTAVGWGIVGRWALWALVAVQVTLYLVGGSPPPNVSTLAWSALILWLFIPWTAWIDRHRQI